MDSGTPTAATGHNPPQKLRLISLMNMSAIWFGLQFFWTSNQLFIMPNRIREFIMLEQGNLERLGFYRGLLDSTGSAVVIFTQLISGYLSDHAWSRRGRRRPFILTGILSGLFGITLFMLAPGYWELYAAYAFMSFCLNLAAVPFQSLLPDLVPKQQENLAGSIMGLNNMGGVLVGLLAYIAMSVVGFEAFEGRMFMLALYFVVLLGTLAATYFGIDEQGWMQEQRQTLSGKLREFTLFPGTTIRYLRNGSNLLSTVVRNYFGLDLKKHPNFMWLSGSRACIYFGYTIFLDWVNYYTKINLDREGWLLSIGLPVEDKYLEIVLAGMMVFFLVGGLLGNIIATPLANWQSKKRVIATGIVVSGGMVVPLIITGDVWQAIISGAVLGIGWGAFVASDWAFGCSLMPKDRAGTFMGLWMLTSLVPAMISPVFSGAVRDFFYNSGLAKLMGTGMSTELASPIAEAAAHRWVFGMIILFFFLGLVILQKVQEQKGYEKRAAETQ
jgi:Na+/melibiose symporter-like transporter